MNKEAFLKEAQDKINALTEKINSLTASLGIQTGDLKEFEALKNVSDDKWEEAKKAFNDISSGNFSEGIQKGIETLKNLF